MPSMKSISEIKVVEFSKAFENIELVREICDCYDHLRNSGFTTEPGKRASDGADTTMGPLCGCHTYSTEYTAFYRPPQLCFLQGEKGVFTVKHMNIVYGANVTQSNPV